jgi:hypothetical protein
MKRTGTAARAVDDDGASPFERFERLARALFAVPKKEIDQKLAAYGRARKAKRAATKR